MINENVAKRNALLAEKVIKGLQSRNMDGVYVQTKEEALAKALEMITPGAKVGWGGSTSVEEIGLKEAVRAGDYQVIDRDKADGPEAKRAAELACFDADFFLCSSNAVTEDGILVNIDGHCNRVAAIAYGPKKVLMIVGMNKVMGDLDAAVSRARHMAATCNAERFNINTPCRKSGSCADCKSPQSICSQFLVTRMVQNPGRITLILVGESLGF